MGMEEKTLALSELPPVSLPPAEEPADVLVRLWDDVERTMAVLRSLDRPLNLARVVEQPARARYTYD
jgi:hypothetical protein